MTTPKLADVPVDQVDVAQQTAVIRLQLFVLGEVHRLINEVQEAGGSVLRRQANTAVSGAAATLALQAYLKAWDKFIDEYTQLIAISIEIAASIPFGTWAVWHDTLVLPHANTPDDGLTIDPFANQPQSVQTVKPFPIFTASNNRKRGHEFTEALNPDVVFEPQLLAIIEAVYERTYGDGFKLSDRIWRLDKQTREAIATSINLAIQQKSSAWELAKQMEQYLGAGQGCPRWTRDRLGLTKKDIAQGDMTGFVSGDECNGQGVAYNALRLARTEIAYAFNAATDKNFAAMPWIHQEQINLSPAHADTDICDTVVSGGEGAKGIYPKGAITLPLHPQCLCFKTAVLMDTAVFTNKLRGWMTGAGSWPEMDSYATTIGGNVGVSLLTTGIGVSLAWWLWGDSISLGDLFWNMALRGNG